MAVGFELDTIDACSDPGATKPKTACVRFAIVEMGPQFVSPSTRRATRPSGRARRMAMASRGLSAPPVAAARPSWARVATTTLREIAPPPKPRRLKLRRLPKARLPKVAPP